MLAAEQYSGLFSNVELPKREPLQIHRSRISLHRAKAGYSYPTIRLPHYLSSLAGLSTRIYQTVHQEALAFLVVVSKNRKVIEQSAQESEKSQNKRQILRLDMAEIAGPNPAEPIVLL
jgi:hypothetical protein